jgi:uncharacterized protein
MEEILASIRRIISDDEQNPARKPAAAAAPQNDQDDEGLEAAEGEADDRIINDIARVLSGGGNAGAPEAPVEAAMAEEEDILDLTAELGGLEPIEEPMEAEVVEMVEVVAEVAPAEAIQAEPPSLEDLQPAPAPQVQAAAPEPAPVTPPPPLSASDEAASALERAIAALRAGQLPTSFSEFSASPAPVFETQPRPEPVTAPEPPAASAEAEPAPEPEVVIAEFETELVIEEPVVIEEVESERRQAPPWEADAPSFAAAVEHEAEREAPRTNGHHDYASAAPRSLEDSVKDLLRPMLRQWLDENMARVLTSALKDELKDNPARFQQD